MEKRDNDVENVVDHATASQAGVANAANRAMRDTAQKYLDAAGVKLNLANIEARVRERALLSVGIAAGVGFVLGGGLATRPGVILLGLFARTAARQSAAAIGRPVMQNAFSAAA